MNKPGYEIAKELLTRPIDQLNIQNIYDDHVLITIGTNNISIALIEDQCSLHLCIIYNHKNLYDELLTSTQGSLIKGLIEEHREEYYDKLREELNDCVFPPEAF